MTLTLKHLRDRCVVDEATGCWVWQQAVNSVGHPMVWSGQRVVGAHRLAWGLFKGEPARRGQYVMRSCGDPLCIAPDHLYLIGQAAMTRYAAKLAAASDSPRRRQALALARQQRTRLTPALAQEIRAAVEGGELQRVVAERYGISRTHISAVVRGVRWAPRPPSWVPL